MKRKPKAIISLLLAVLMMATVLAGCGGTASSTKHCCIICIRQLSR